MERSEKECMRDGEERACMSVCVCGWVRGKEYVRGESECGGGVRGEELSLIHN